MPDSCSSPARRAPFPDRPPPRTIVALLVVLSAWAIAYELGDTVLPALGKTLPFAGIVPDMAFVLAGLLLIGRGFRDERGWTLMGFGALCWAAGDVYWQLRLAKLTSPPVPSWADAGYLSFCPLELAGLFSLVRARAEGVPRTTAVDALAATLAVGAFSAAVVVQPVLATASGRTLSVATNLAYPLADLLLLGLIVSATALGNWRLNRTWVLLAASVVVFWVADSVYLIAVATNSYHDSAWFNPLWHWSPILAGWAAWLPRSAPRPTAKRETSIRGVVLPLVFAFAALVILVWSSFDRVGVLALGLATSSLLVIMWRLVLTWRENAVLLQVSQDEAVTDPLTGLRNRRALIADLERRIRAGEQQFSLVMFDLDGFKHYNDSFGHPAGDTLLQRLGRNLELHLAERGTAYRMGGDEFCALIAAPPSSAQAAAALSERGDGFEIGCSFGSVLLPSEARDVESALRIADQRMYDQKRGSRASASRQSKDVLLRALVERSPDLGDHLLGVAELAAVTAWMFLLPVEEIEQIRQAAELHDVGKVAIPDEILEKPTELDDSEWAFIHRHTLIGERIIAAAPALRGVARLVRSSHENFDGSGYPDRLADREIPLGSRIIAVCDAFDAMTSDRPYRHAMDERSAIDELRRCAGSQFDPAVVDRVCEALDSVSQSVLHAVRG